MSTTRDMFRGPWAGLPVAWTDDDQFHEAAYRADVARCCHAGMPGVYTGGTTGEFYAMELDEFREVARATIEECHAHGQPAMVGCTRLGCHAMQSVFNADNPHRVPFMGAPMSPPRLFFSAHHSELHMPGRHLNALLSAEAAAGIQLDEAAVKQHARAAFFSYPRRADDVFPILELSYNRTWKAALVKTPYGYLRSGM